MSKMTIEEARHRAECLKNETIALLLGKKSCYMRINGNRLLEHDFNVMIDYMNEQEATIMDLTEKIDELETILHQK